MAPALERPRKTLADWRALPDETQAELIRGEIYVTPSPSGPHQSAVLALGSLLRIHGARGASGRAYVAPFDVHLPSGDVVQPDVLFAGRRHPGLEDGCLRGAPDLVVEIVSPSHPLHDRVVKRDLYARNGVPEYWIVDPQERTIEILRLAGDAYVPAGYGTGDQVLASPTLVGLTVPLAEAFE